MVSRFNRRLGFYTTGMPLYRATHCAPLGGKLTPCIRRALVRVQRRGVIALKWVVIFPCPHSDRIFLVPKAEVLPLYQPVAIEISGELPELHFQTANTAGMRKLQDAATPQACVRRLQDAANSQGDQHNVNSAQGRFLEYDTESDSHSVYSQRQRGSSLAEEEGDGYDDYGTITYDHVQEGDCDGTEGDCDGSRGCTTMRWRMTSTLRGITTVLRGCRTVQRRSM